MEYREPYFDMKRVLEYYCIEYARDEKKGIYICENVFLDKEGGSGLSNEQNPLMIVGSRQRETDAECFSCNAMNLWGTAREFISRYEKQLGNALSPGELNWKLAMITAGDEPFLDELLPADYEQKLVLHNEFFHRFSRREVAYSQIGKEYCADRGLDEKTVEHFELGFIPKQNAFSFCAKQFGYDLSLYKNFDDSKKGLGLLNEKEELKMRDRLIVPIHDENGRLIAFSGRLVKDDPQKKWPKYLNSQENPLFEKNEVLFNFHRCKADSHGKPILICEGFMDVIGAWQMGIENAVASMGVSISMKEKSLLMGNENKPVLCFDADEAGRNAMLREIPELLRQSFNVQAADLRKLEAKFVKDAQSPHKDLMDYALLGAKKADLEEIIEPGLDFLISNQYLQIQKENGKEAVSGPMSIFISEGYDKAQKDGLFQISGAKERFFEIACELSGWSQTDVRSLCTNEPDQAKVRYKSLDSVQVCRWMEHISQTKKPSDVKVMLSKLQAVQSQSGKKRLAASKSKKEAVRLPER